MIDQWLGPVADDAPSGPCLEYDRRFQSLASASRGRGEQQLGSSILPAEDPDWHFLAAESAELIKESRDIRLLVIWTYASLRLSGLEGLASGVQTIARLLEHRWDSIHPLMEPDGDWYIRSNAVAGLADPDSMLPVLRDLVAGSVRGIAITVRNVCALAEGQQPESSPVANLEQLRIAFQDERTECSARFDACSRILAGLASINTTFASRLGQDAQPSLQPLQHIVAVLQSLYAPAPAQDPQGDGNVAEGSGVAESPDFSAQVHSRSDALRALAVAREYFERHEPSNPAPLLIKRVERLAASSFLEIIEEMAPSSMDHIKMQTGLSR